MAKTTSGTVRLDDVTDSEIGQMFAFKAKHEGQLTFNDTQWAAAQNGKNNVIISWSSQAGYDAAHELVNLLRGTSSPGATAGQ